MINLEWSPRLVSQTLAGGCRTHLELELSVNLFSCVLPTDLRLSKTQVQMFSSKKQKTSFFDHLKSGLFDQNDPNRPTSPGAALPHLAAALQHRVGRRNPCQAATHHLDWCVFSAAPSATGGLGSTSGTDGRVDTELLQLFGKNDESHVPVFDRCFKRTCSWVFFDRTKNMCLKSCLNICMFLVFGPNSTNHVCVFESTGHRRRARLIWEHVAGSTDKTPLSTTSVCIVSQEHPTNQSV